MRRTIGALLVVLSWMVVAGGGEVAGAADWTGPAGVGIEVRDEAGQPIPGAAVVLAPGAAAAAPAEGEAPPFVFTDAGGRVEVRNLAEGEWQVEVRASGYMIFNGYLRLAAAAAPEVGFSSRQRTGTFWQPLEVRFFVPGSPGDAVMVAATKEERRGEKKRIEEREQLERQEKKAQERAEVRERRRTRASGGDEVAVLKESPKPVAESQPPPRVAEVPPPPAPPPPVADPPPARERGRPQPPAPAAPPASPASPPPPPVAPPPAAAPPSVAESAPPSTAAPPASSPPAVEPPPRAIPPSPAPPPAAPPPAAPPPSEVAPPPAPPPSAVPAEPEASPPSEPRVADAGRPAVDGTRAAPAPDRPSAPAPDTPAPAAPAPAPAAPAPAPPPAAPDPPRAVPSIQTRPVLFTGGACPECKPGEWALIVERRAAPAGSAAVIACGEGREAAVRRLAREALVPAGATVAAFAGAVADSYGNGLPAAVRDSVPAELAEALGPREGACQDLIGVLPQGARFIGFRFEAEDASGKGDCFGEEPCAIGQARWMANPRIERTTTVTLVHSSFVNESTAAERRARMTLYFQPPRGWRPPA